MTYRPARRLADIEPFHVVELLTRARQLESEGRDIIHMEVGEPDFPTPEPITKAAVAAIQGGKTLYTQALGLPELRTAISDFYRERYGVAVAASRIAITNGASGALNLAFAALANPGDEWLLADPGYPCNRHILRTYEGCPISMPVGPDSNFQPTPAMLRQYWNEKTAGLLVASPANPTGTLLTLAEIEALAAVCREKQGYFLVDEIYHGLTYEIAAPTACAAGDDIWVINSFSKYFQMTGWRLGWLVVPQDYVEPAIRLAQNLFLCPPASAQHAALAAFQPAVLDVLESRRAEFGRRRDFLLQALPELGWRIDAVPDGAFYVYADVSAVTDDSFAYCQRMLDEVKVAITPGADFGSHRAGSYVRVAYTTGIERLAEAVARMKTVR